MAPKCVVCYICGREYGTRSISIHENQCLNKWKIENKKLPPNQRRPPPTRPQVLPSISGRTQHDIDRWNEIASQSAAAHMAACENCGRTFNPDRLSIHQRSCRPGKTSSPVRGKENLLTSRFNRNVHPGYEHEYEYEDEYDFQPSADITEYVEFDDDYNMSSSERPLTNTLKNPKILHKLDVNDYPGPHKSPRRVKGNYHHNHRKDRRNDSRKPADYKPQAGGFKFANKPGHRPGGGQFVHCYICNQKFTTASIKFHEPSCLKKWHITQEQLPPHLRQRPPVKPKEFDMMFNDGGSGGGGGGVMLMGNDESMGENVKLTGKGKYNINAYNAAMQKAAETNMAQCPHCKRTFNPDRIQKHEIICRKTKKGRTERSRQVNAKGPSKIGLMPSASKKARKYDVQKDRRRKYHSVLDTPQGRRHGFVICPGCGRQYTHASIQIHLPKCGSGKKVGGLGKSRVINHQRESGQ